VRIVFGVGFTGARVAELAISAGEDVLAVVRSEESVARLSARGISATCERAEVVAREHVSAATHAIVCFPPDGATDAALAPLLANAAATTYVSTTGVYGALEGAIDDDTSVPLPTTDSIRTRLAAEKAYRDVGSTILRAPGIYGPERGLHVRIQKGLHVIPGDGSNHVSLIHVDDLARFTLASRAVREETFVVSDLSTERNERWSSGYVQNTTAHFREARHPRRCTSPCDETAASTARASARCCP
jgi:nucleoside-diphosphate-sugar epimerase